MKIRAKNGEQTVDITLPSLPTVQYLLSCNIYVPAESKAGPGHRTVHAVKHIFSLHSLSHVLFCASLHPLPFG